MLPDDLTPEELSTALREAREAAFRPVYMPTEESDGGEEEEEEGAGNAESAISPHLSGPVGIHRTPATHLDLTTGSGSWQGHPFTLGAPEMKAIRTILAARVAADLEAEAARLRSESAS